LKRRANRTQRKGTFQERLPPLKVRLAPIVAITERKFPFLRDDDDADTALGRENCEAARESDICSCHDPIRVAAGSERHCVRSPSG